MRRLFTVTETFTVQGRGIVLLPELRPVADEHFRVGDPLRLRRPDGTEDLVQIGGIEFLKPLSGKDQVVVMLLGKEKEYVPAGTEVWSVERATQGKIEFLDPWSDFIPGQDDVFVRELQRELSPGHPIYGLRLFPLGHSGAADDALFEAEDGRVFQVHLTFSHRAEQPPLPSTQVYRNTGEWVQAVMLPANEEYRA